MKINFTKSFDGTIRYQIDGTNVANMPIVKNYQLPEKMKFFIGGQTSNINVAESTPLGVIRNLTIEAVKPETCFNIRSCKPNGKSCINGDGDEIIIFKNQQKISEIEKGFVNYEECFTSEENDEFEFHIGGIDNVSHFFSARRQFSYCHDEFSLSMIFGRSKSGCKHENPLFCQYFKSGQRDKEISSISLIIFL